MVLRLPEKEGTKRGQKRLVWEDRIIRPLDGEVPFLWESVSLCVDLFLGGVALKVGIRITFAGDTVG